MVSPELILPWCSTWAHGAPKTHQNIHYGSGCVPYKPLRQLRTITGSSPCSHVQSIQLIICPPTATHTAPFQRFAVHLISVLFLIPMPLDRVKDIKKIIKSFNHSVNCICVCFFLSSKHCTNISPRLCLFPRLTQQGEPVSCQRTRVPGPRCVHPYEQTVRWDARLQRWLGRGASLQR